MVIDPSSAPAALLAHVAWTELHTLLILGNRSILINTGRSKPSGFVPSRFETGDTFIGRVSLAHFNCIENLPKLAAVILVNAVTGGPDIGALAWAWMAARVGQSLLHWWSVKDDSVITARFLCYATQLGLLGYMGYKTLVE